MCFCRFRVYVRIGLVAFLCVCGGICFAEDRIASDLKPPGVYFGLGAADHAGAASFKYGEPVVGVSYFYWYDVDSKAHIINSDGTDALTTHPVDMENISFIRINCNGLIGGHKCVFRAQSRVRRAARCGKMLCLQETR